MPFILCLFQDSNEKKDCMSAFVSWHCKEMCVDHPLYNVQVAIQVEDNGRRKFPGTAQAVT
jgi:hypothetical protein